ncbi:MAG: UbiA family prenyltransferase [Candidatus Heimdallarchaeota archaeon]|nr:UbiA family prenyltransferase [Candidatus Heimdallarchaeota archaeon]MCK4289800.1 UbiA family prenyltransferase [Candidatus Heimdallarchaeota archaeon]
MAETVNQKENRFKFVKGFVGLFRLMHILPVMTVTTIGIFIAILILKGTGTFAELFQNITINEILMLIFFILTIFFQEGFLGVQNDYIDRDIDAEYNKSKTIPDGWLSPNVAFWWAIVCYVLFTGFSAAVGIWAEIGFWIIPFVQGATLTGIFYNLYAKHRPISIVPYMLGFPLIPVFAWLTFGFASFEFWHLWMLPVMFLTSFPAHIANELPDFDLDVEHEKRNFAVFLGYKLATIVYWLGIILLEIILLIVFLVYNLNPIAFAIAVSLSLLIGLSAVFFLWKNEWKTNTFIFNIVTSCIGVIVLGFYIMVGLGPIV